MLGEDDDLFGDEDDTLEDDLECDEVDEVGIDYAGSDPGVEQAFAEPPVVQFADTPRFSELQNPGENLFPNRLSKVLRGKPVKVQYDKVNFIVKVTMADGRILTIRDDS